MKIITVSTTKINLRQRSKESVGETNGLRRGLISNNGNTFDATFNVCDGI